jgi:hypothetical protein
MPRLCFHCNSDNPENQAFCGSCGSPLILSDYVSARVSKEFAAFTKDRQILETESAIRVFERAWGWVKIVGGIAAALIALAGVGVLWKVSDWWKSVDSAKQSVISTANSTKDEITQGATDSLKQIQDSAGAAKTQSEKASQMIGQQVKGLDAAVAQTKRTMQQEASHLKDDVADARSKLAAANALQPQMQQMQQQLGEESKQLEDQKKLISSSEEFVKQIFSTHEINTFNVAKESTGGKYAVLPPPDKSSGGNSTVFLLLDATPIPGTLQLQYHIYTQPPYSYFVLVHNLVVFFWGQSTDQLSQQPLYASFFPDKRDKDTIQKLTVKDGRVYADGEPMPFFNRPDPTFKGNKWILYPPSKGSVTPH